MKVLIAIFAFSLVIGIYFMTVEDMGIVWRATQGQTL